MKDENGKKIIMCVKSERKLLKIKQLKLNIEFIELEIEEIKQNLLYNSEFQQQGNNDKI